MRSNLDIAIRSNADKTTRNFLRDDDSLLRQVFFSVLRHHHPTLANKVDVIYALSQAWCSSRSEDDFSLLEKYLSDLKPDERILVASSFSHMLNLHNLTEEVNNNQIGRAVCLGDMDSPTRDTNVSLIKLTSQNGYTPQQVYEALCNQTVELVLTAHPTQALRASLLRKYANVRHDLDNMHSKRMTEYEKIETLESIRANVQAAWRTDEIRRSKPTPQDEMRLGLNYFHEVIFHTIPVFHRRIDTALANLGLPRLPLDNTLFKFGSWMGGDRDGNPNVTFETTRDVVLLARLEAADEFFHEVEDLMFDLSVWRCTPEVKALATQLSLAERGDPARIAEERKKRNYSDFWTPVPVTEPYRVILSNVRDRLYVTRQVLHQCLIHSASSVRGALEEAGAYLDDDEIAAPLKLMYTSLLKTGDESVANSRLLDVIRQIRTFGLALMRLDIRQESTRHTEVLDAITQYLGLGSYASWSEEERVQFLLRELQGKRPLLPPGMPLASDPREVIATMKMLRELPRQSLGTYVISMAKTASDVLAVVLLQREAGIKEPLRVAPLFETLEDLHNAPATIRQLFSSPWYLNHIGGVQECMIGYSDSGKDAGRMAAAWALFETQENIVEVANEFNVKMVLFHGRGGTVGRGGGPTHMAIRSQPAGTINGCLRVTVQGETIERQFGEKDACFRTLDLYSSAVLEAGLDPPTAPKAEWRKLMDVVSRASCAHYREVVYKDPDFYSYFASATPASELGRLNIGSRPSSRKTGGIETLRAIPWIFAWTQQRLNLPVWLGIGEGLQAAIQWDGDEKDGEERKEKEKEKENVTPSSSSMSSSSSYTSHANNATSSTNGLNTLRDMYEHWPFFQSTVDLVEMVMAKTDPDVSRYYERTLTDQALWGLGENLRKGQKLTHETLLYVIRKNTLLESAAGGSASPHLDEKLRLRAPYVAPLNVLQALCIRALRDYKTKGICAEYRPQNEEVLGLISRDPSEESVEIATKHPFLAATDDCLLITIKGVAAGMQNTG